MTEIYVKPHCESSELIRYCAFNEASIVETVVGGVVSGVVGGVVGGVVAGIVADSLPGPGIPG